MHDDMPGNPPFQRSNSVSSRQQGENPDARIALKPACTSSCTKYEQPAPYLRSTSTRSSIKGPGYEQVPGRRRADLGIALGATLRPMIRRCRDRTPRTPSTGDMLFLVFG